MSLGAAAPYEALLEHAELELQLASRGEIDGLLALERRWSELVAELPAAPPRDAAGALARARLLHERTRAELLRLRDSLLGEFAAAGAAKRAAGGYGGATPAAAPRVDRSA